VIKLVKKVCKPVANSQRGNPQTIPRPPSTKEEYQQLQRVHKPLAVLCKYVKLNLLNDFPPEGAQMCLALKYPHSSVSSLIKITQMQYRLSTLAGPQSD
jgi:hypothetical protein